MVYHTLEYGVNAFSFPILTEYYSDITVGNMYKLVNESANGTVS